MKQIINNRYFKVFKFSSSQEETTFLNKAQVGKILSINNTFGDNYYCYVCYDSLTSKKLYALTFCSDENEESLNFLFWENKKRIILDTGKNIYIVEEDLNIAAIIDVTTPLIGLHLIDKEKLLLLEEAFMRVIDSEGKILKSETFDLINNFTMEGTTLYIQTDEENKIFELN